MRWSWPVLLPLLMQLFLRLLCFSECSEYLSHCSRRRRDCFPLWLPRQHTQINASVVAQTALRSDLRYVINHMHTFSPCCGEHTTCNVSSHTDRWASHDVSVWGACGETLFDKLPCMRTSCVCSHEKRHYSALVVWFIGLLTWFHVTVMSQQLRMPGRPSDGVALQKCRQSSTRGWYTLISTLI